MERRYQNIDADHLLHGSIDEISEHLKVLKNTYGGDARLDYHSAYIEIIMSYDHATYDHATDVHPVDCQPVAMAS